MTNIAKEYIDFSEDSIYKYMRIVMKNQISRNNFKELINAYNSVKYYNYLPTTSKNMTTNINYYLKEKIDELYGGFSPQKRQEIMVPLKQIFALDTVHEDQIESSVLAFNLSSEESHELTSSIKDNIKRKVKFFNEFKTDTFSLKYTRTDNKKVSLVDLEYDIEFNPIYSKRAIKEVYNSSTIDEQKLFIEYNLVAIKILKEVINNDFCSRYIVDFPYSIFGKKAKKNRLFNIVNSDAIKEKLIIKMNYLNYESNEDQVIEMLQNGYKMALELDDHFKPTKTNVQKLELFEYVITKQEMTELKPLKDKLIIVRK